MFDVRLVRVTYQVQWTDLAYISRSGSIRWGGGHLTQIYLLPSRLTCRIFASALLVIMVFTDDNVFAD